jgi:hypothetical protein
MSNNIKNGRKPLSSKGEPNPYEGFFSRTITDIDPSLKAELEAKGLEWRWISNKEFAEAGNQHHNYWTPYQTKQTAEKSGDILNFGTTSDGFIRRKTMVLAARPKQLGDAHRAQLKQKAARLQGDAERQNKSELEEVASRAGIKAKIDVGYDD